MDGGADHPMANKSFVITAVLVSLKNDNKYNLKLFLQNPPYTMYVESFEKLTGNEMYEGFAVDLATALSSILGFNFTFKLVDDGKVDTVYCI